MPRFKPSDLIDISRQHANAAEGLRHAIARLGPEVHWEKASLRLTRQLAAELRRDLPYSVKSTSVAGAYILVNRQHKPIGSTSTEWAKYDEFPNLHMALSDAQINDIEGPYLFNDGTAPWDGLRKGRAYMARLEELLHFIR